MTKMTIVELAWVLIVAGFDIPKLSLLEVCACVKERNEWIGTVSMFLRAVVIYQIFRNIGYLLCLALTVVNLAINSKQTSRLPQKPLKRRSS